jgi:hypothetical protein
MSAPTEQARIAMVEATPTGQIRLTVEATI